MSAIRIVLPLWSAIAIGCSGSDGGPGPEGPQGPPGDQGTPGEIGDPGAPGQGIDFGYVGSEACGDCHAESYAGWMASGHPYKLVSKDDVVAGTAYPTYVQTIQGEVAAVDADFFTDQAALISINENTFPSGGFDDVTYVIGGYGWKARFIGTDGYIITGTDHGTPGDTSDDDKVQYNVPYSPPLFGDFAYGDVPASSATYHTGEMKPYTCGGCHTTGWIPDEDADTDGDLSDNQDGLAGIHGTWVETGVGCEACHGPSAGHAADPYQVTTSMPANDSCGGCHVRGWPWEIDTKDGFIRHHEQFEELVNSKHAAIGCEGCHDPHQPVQYRVEYMALEDTAWDPNPNFTNRSGIRTECTSCHWEEQASYAAWAEATAPALASVTCEHCHMPSAVKSAVKAGTYSGDVRSHLFSINTLVDPAANPELTTTGANPANPYLSLDWACGGCHTDTVEGTDTDNPDFYVWAINALQANGGVHGGN